MVTKVTGSAERHPGGTLPLVASSPFYSSATTEDDDQLRSISLLPTQVIFGKETDGILSILLGPQPGEVEEPYQYRYDVRVEQKQILCVWHIGR